MEELGESDAESDVLLEEDHVSQHGEHLEENTTSSTNEEQDTLNNDDEINKGELDVENKGEGGEEASSMEPSPGNTILDTSQETQGDANRHSSNNNFEHEERNSDKDANSQLEPRPGNTILGTRKEMQGAAKRPSSNNNFEHEARNSSKEANSRLLLSLFVAAEHAFESKKGDTDFVDPFASQLAGTKGEHLRKVCLSLLSRP